MPRPRRKNLGAVALLLLQLASSGAAAHGVPRRTQAQPQTTTRNASATVSVKASGIAGAFAEDDTVAAPPPTAATEGLADGGVLGDDGLVDDDARFYGSAFGVVDLQIRSRSGSGLNDFLFHVLSVTTALLDEQLVASSSPSGAAPFHKGVVFDHVRLGVNSYDLVEAPTIEVNTSATSEDKVLSFGRFYDAAVSLQGVALFDPGAKRPWRYEAAIAVRRALTDRAAAYQARLAATGNPLLRDLKFLIVTLNGETLSGGNYSAAFTGAAPQGTPLELGTAAGPRLPTWALALLTGVGSFCLVLALCYVLLNIRTVCRRGRQRAGVVPQPKLTADTDDDEEDGLSTPRHSDILSVASSSFTYNPAHLYSDRPVKVASIAAKSGGGSGNASAAAHALLRFHTDTGGIDKKDLSLICEEPSEDGASQRSASSQGAARRRYPAPPLASGAGGDPALTALDLNGAPSDVLEDLQDLSAQIDTHRRSTKGGDLLL